MLRAVALSVLAVGRGGRLRSQCATTRCAGDDDAAYNGGLVDRAAVVRRFGDRDPARYLSVLDVDGGVLIAARTGAFPSADGARTALRVEFGCLANLGGCSGGPVELFGGVNDATAHNAGLFLWRGGLYALGGLYAEGDPARLGLRLRGPVAPTRAGLESLGAAPPRTAMAGDHAGGIDRRPRTGTYCEYDGRVSVAVLRGSARAFARANLVRNKTVDGGFGGRHVQVAASADLQAFDAFRGLAIEQFPPGRRACDAPASGDNVYFGAVNANPVDDDTLLGLFPVVRNAPRGGDDAYVGLGLSCDGVRFSALERLVNSTPASLGRSSDHPADGIVVRGDSVFFFVHRGVPGVFDDDHAAAAIAGSRVVRYELSKRALTAFTRRAKATLAGCGSAAPPRGDPASPRDRCWLECARSARARKRHRDVKAVDACVAGCEARHPPCAGA